MILFGILKLKLINLIINILIIYMVFWRIKHKIIPIIFPQPEKEKLFSVDKGMEPNTSIKASTILLLLLTTAN